jgi:hypothetical protein
MIKQAYLLGYSKVAISLSPTGELPMADDVLKSGKMGMLLNRIALLSADALDTMYDVNRAKQAKKMIEEEEHKIDKKSEFQPMDMPPAGEPDYIEDVSKIPLENETQNSPKYAKRQAPANQKGTQYE